MSGNYSIYCPSGTKIREEMNPEAAIDYAFKLIVHNDNHHLYYHNYEHSLDVYNSAIRIARQEEISEHDMKLLKTAAMYHDAGMTRTYIEHEKASVAIAREVLPGYGYSDDDLKKIEAMIMATELPQEANSPLERIICDADLDYLGRTDFFMIAHRLRQEWFELDFKKTTLREWYMIQVDFLGNHTYFTQTAIKTRREGKMRNLEMIQEVCRR